MIVVKLAGGIGNQMFQYAMARALARRNNTEVFIDKSLCANAEGVNSSGIALRCYELDIFNIVGQTADGECRKKTVKVRKEQKFRRSSVLLFCKFFNFFTDRFRVVIYERKSVRFDKTLLKLPDNIYLRGYFPSFKYFNDSEELIRQDFTFNKEPDEQNHNIINEIVCSNSVSVHVRRGDYITSQTTKDKFGVCSPDYYKRSTQHIADKIRNPHFFVFSNDIQWAKDNIKTGYRTTYVTHNTGKNNYEDMRLMSLCKHNIIANSSFSWWAAWLNRNPAKIVICPTPVFDRLDIRDDDFYPKHWTRLPKN
jgi:hypothetical protein